MEYNYYKDKYKAYTLRLDRVQDADLIAYLDSCDSITGLIRGLVRAYIAALLNGPFEGKQ